MDWFCLYVLIASLRLHPDEDNCTLQLKSYKFCMELDERKLRAFLAVADGGSLGRAAGAINLTQPTLSRLIQDMEARLGQRLFDRHGKGMALTAAGQALMPHARLLVFELDMARNRLDELRGLRRGSIRIGAVAAAMRTVLPIAIGRLIAKLPGLDVHTLEAAEDRLFNALIQREIDLVVASGSLELEGVSRVQHIQYEDSFAVFCTAGHPIDTAPGLNEALAENWIMPPPGATPRRQFEALVQISHCHVPRIAVESESVDAMIAIVRHSHLLGWLPEPMLAPHLASGVIRTLDIPALTYRRVFSIYRRSNGTLPEAARQMMAELLLLEDA